MRYDLLTPYDHPLYKYPIDAEVDKKTMLLCIYAKVTHLNSPWTYRVPESKDGPDKERTLKKRPCASERHVATTQKKRVLHRQAYGPVERVGGWRRTTTVVVASVSGRTRDAIGRVVDAKSLFDEA